jgi:hypothetical protein
MKTFRKIGMSSLSLPDGAVVPSLSYCIPFSGIASIVLSSYLAGSDIKNI